jgi:hypothetical protein
MTFHPVSAHLAVVRKELDTCAILLRQTPAAHITDIVVFDQ